MAIECGIITGLLLAMAVFFFAKKHKQWGWATLPLTLVPLTDFVMNVVFVRVFHMSISLYWGVLVLLIAVAISSAWIGFVANSLTHKSSKATYIGISNAFNVLLAAILINNILEVIKEYGEVIKGL